MALYQTQTTSSLADLVSKLNTFLTTGGGGNPGWSADRHVPGSGEWAISKSDGGSHDVEVAFQWDTASPNALGIYQYRSGSGAGNYNTGNAPYAQTDDSGNGAASTSDASLLLARHVPITNTPQQYWAFTGDTYAHIVVKTAASDYVHFGFGVLDKFNDWTGGEYAYGYRYQGGTNNSVAIQVLSCHLLDGLMLDSGSITNAEEYVATIHAEGLANGPTSSKYAVHMGNQSSSNLGNDRQGTPRGRTHFTCGFRAGPHAMSFGQFAGLVTTGLIPVYPIVSYHWNRTSGSFTPMGQMKDVRGVMMKNFAAEDTVVIGSDTWHIFPSRRLYTGTMTNSTGYQGIMYKEN